MNDTDFKKFKDCGYAFDKNIPERTWNAYLKKYSEQYQLKRDECGVWYLVSTIGEIKPYSIVNSKLGAYLTLGNRKRSFLMRKVPSYCNVFQDSDDAISIWFPEEKLHEVSDIFEIRRKKKLSPEHKERLRMQMLKVNKQRNEVKG